jgi:hypothetical protein
LKITESTNDGVLYIHLSGAPPKAAIEVRWQNTLSGATYVDVAETNDQGNATMTPPYNYGQGFVPKARILNDKTNQLVSFSFDGEAFVTEKTEQQPPSNIISNVPPVKG